MSPPSRSRDHDCSQPPPQIRTSRVTASDSLGCTRPGAQGEIRVTNASRRKPPLDDTRHAAPRQMVTLTATAQPRPPQITHGFAEFFDFPIRSAALFSADRRGISRFPHKVPAYLPGVSDRARSGHTLRWRCTRCCLPLSSTALASRVNASTPPSRAAPHDSGWLWFARFLQRMKLSFTTPCRF